MSTDDLDPFDEDAKPARPKRDRKAEAEMADWLKTLTPAERKLVKGLPKP